MEGESTYPMMRRQPSWLVHPVLALGKFDGLIAAI